MKVILNADVSSVGRKGDVVEVARGYARNYLFPRNLALKATKGGLKQAEGMQRSRAEKEERERAEAAELASRITATPIRIAARAGEEGQLFGSVTTSDITERLSSELSVEIDRRKVHIEDSIRSVGVHEFEVRLHPDVTAKGTLEIVPE